MHISILLFDGVDLLDSGGPYEVFLTANRLAERAGDDAPFTIDTVTLDGRSARAYGGLGLVPSAAAEVLATTDLLIVPGTVDLSGPLADTELIDAISEVARAAPMPPCRAWVPGRFSSIGPGRWTADRGPPTGRTSTCSQRAPARPGLGDASDGSTQAPS